MEKDKHFDKIEAYLRGELPDEEAKIFREELAKDPMLQSELLKHRLANRAIEMAQDDYLKEKMQAIHEEYGPLPKPVAKVVGMRLWLANAAAILILVVAGIEGYSYLNYSDNALIKTHYEQAASPTIAGSDAEIEQWFSQGLYLYYQQKDYAAALESFSAIESGSERYETAQYFIAHCQLRTGAYDKALTKFDEMLEAENIPPFAEREKLEWNRILCYLGLGEDERASQALQTIIKSDEYTPEMKEQAEALNKKMNSFWRGLTF